MVSELFLVFRAVFVDSIFYELRIANNLQTVFCGTDVVLPGHSQQKIQQLWLFSDNCSQFFQLFTVRCHFHIRLEEMRLHLLSQLLTIADKGRAADSVVHKILRMQIAVLQGNTFLSSCPILGPGLCPHPLYSKAFFKR